MRKNAGKLRYHMYVGTYTSGESEGIYIFEMDPSTGRLEPAGVAGGVRNPSYLALSRDQKFLYSVGETDEFRGEIDGSVAAFAINSETGGLKLLNMQPAGGRAPCHLSTDGANRYLFSANYKEGTVSVFPINKGGWLSPASCIRQHQGMGPVIDRQDKAHAHYAALTPDDKYLCVADLGIDRIMLYIPDMQKGSLTLAEELPITVRPGSGPRHMAFHPDGRHAYLLNELSSDVIVLEYSFPVFRQLHCISALPEGYEGESYGAAVHVSSDGRFLYTSNRGHDSIAVFEIDRNSGMLGKVSCIPALGKFPRDFGLDPSGRFLYVANQYSDTIETFFVNPDTGIPEAAHQTVRVPSPVCIKFTDQLQQEGVLHSRRVHK